ncbi:uncharacterized protein LOC126846865 [Adelges cooleyi]|uniref:uncharacterized protein LOC126846865 n=1 Tax=Adelges cooleyi TaxID=133065 RepID=UPI00217F879A|nr:uncharacterized protein LOC126846865 [Adelges cooleyi]XP_050442660.1 uncharacterized protein LOC126846865 [Adelges cooleyi]XP_050442670.1 uncharacterized protein LOC126846865 [Adelges cooleyi]XP_050442679.1 uncharacterized protein LOC126846865 [Adelges cooleyi]
MSTMESFMESPEKEHQLKTRLEQLQYEYFNGRPEWTTVSLGDLNLYIAYTYFGTPFRNDDQMEENVLESFNGTCDIFTQYSNEEQDHINKIVEVIKNNIIKDQLQFTEIEIGATLVHSICKIKCEDCKDFPEKDIHTWCLLRIKINKSITSYIDVSFSRSYDDWKNYLEYNTLPDGYIFYPKSGIYNEADYLEQGYTPAASTHTKVLNTVDVVGRVTSFVSGALMVGGLFVPVMAPVLLPAAAVAAGSSAWDAGRQINSLVDRGQHNQSLSDAEAGKHWLNLTISTLGVITAPLTAGVKTLELSGSSIIASKYGKTLLMLKDGACITQCSLSIIGLTTDIISGVTMKKLLNSILTYLRLDVFVVTGMFLSLPIIRTIYQSVAECFPCSSNMLYQNIFSEKTIPFFLITKFFKGAVRYAKRYFDYFYKCIIKFMTQEITIEKLIYAWKDIIKFYTMYKEQIKSIAPPDYLEYALAHMSLGLSVAGDIDAAKIILGGRKMKKLLSQIPERYMDQKMVIFSIKQVVKKANELMSQLDDTVQECMIRGETDCHKITKMFCLEYKIKECCLTEYLLYGIRELRKDVSNLVNEYLVYKSINHEYFRIDCEPFTDKFKMFEMPSPTEVLDKDICMELAQELNPQEDAYNLYEFKLVETTMSMLYMNSTDYNKYVFFKLQKIEENSNVCISFIKIANSQYT